MPDAFAMHGDSAEAPARKIGAVTPNDSTDLADTPKALWVSAAGTLNVVALNDAANTGTALGTLPVGTLVPIRVRRVRATGTTATVIALY
jgi:hypothetical protein